jgi:hypothetical protein
MYVHIHPQRKELIAPLFPGKEDTPKLILAKAEKNIPSEWLCLARSKPKMSINEHE